MGQRVDAVTNACLDAMAQWTVSLNPTFFPSLSLGLYVNDVQVTQNMNLAYLGECTSPRYARVPLLPKYWTGQTAGGESFYMWPVIQFGITKFSDPSLCIRGHFVIETKTGNVWWGVRWDKSWNDPTVPGSGDAVLQVLPLWYGQQCNPPPP